MSGLRRLAPLAVLVTLHCAAAGAESTPRATSRSGDDSLNGLLDGFKLGGEGGPVRVTADTMEFDYKTKMLTYRGAVSVTQADLTLRSKELRVNLDPDKPQRPREVIAEGDVQITKGTRKASGGRAVFDDAARTITLSEQARLQDGLNEIAGEKVIVYLDEERSVVEGGRERVRAVLYPPGEGTPSAIPGADVGGR